MTAEERGETSSQAGLIPVSKLNTPGTPWRGAADFIFEKVMQKTQKIIQNELKREPKTIKKPMKNQFEKKIGFFEVLPGMPGGPSAW